MESPSSKRVASVHARKGTRLMAERIKEEEWRFLNVANDSLQFDIRTTSPVGYAVLSRRDLSSSADVFSAIFSRDFISSVLENILQSNPNAFCTTLAEEGSAMHRSRQGMCIRPLLVGCGFTAKERLRARGPRMRSRILSNGSERDALSASIGFEDFARTQ